MRDFNYCHTWHVTHTHTLIELALSYRNSSHVDAGAFPPLYMEVYNQCLKDGALSTELLFPVLMSSQLPKQRLGELWQLANRGTPGKLSQTELFVLLGLIGLVQVLMCLLVFYQLNYCYALPGWSSQSKIC